ncbi:hypothetical protein AGLY_009369 [Aphis glycines]|uniref:Uncharacterized protein n=1 Tax=Aphis glycines TaxID=307491 RepID=A0A6G0THV1_APHGL|nr:hypothetical protein AGLY_009369 [Aphis glycines]
MDLCLPQLAVMTCGFSCILDISSQTAVKWCFAVVLHVKFTARQLSYILSKTSTLCNRKNRVYNYMMIAMSSLKPRCVQLLERPAHLEIYLYLNALNAEYHNDSDYRLSKQQMKLKSYVIVKELFLLHHEKKYLSQDLFKEEIVTKYKTKCIVQLNLFHDYYIGQYLNDLME